MNSYSFGGENHYDNDDDNDSNGDNDEPIQLPLPQGEMNPGMISTWNTCLHYLPSFPLGGLQYGQQLPGGKYFSSLVHNEPGQSSNLQSINFAL